MNFESITSPGNEHVFAVTVKPDEGGGKWKYSPVPGMVVLAFQSELFGPTVAVRVDGQALADALAKLGYRAETTAPANSKTNHTPTGDGDGWLRRDMP